MAKIIKTPTGKTVSTGTKVVVSPTPAVTSAPAKTTTSKRK